MLIRELSNKLTYFRNICYRLAGDHVYWSSHHSAYESYQLKLYNKEEQKYYYETRYRAVKYTEYYNTNEVSISFQYKAISLETGEVLFSKVVNKNIQKRVL